MIVETITDPYHFWNWVKMKKQLGDSYGNCFTQQGAYALQSYLDDLS